MKEKKLREAMEAQGKDIQEITEVIEESRKNIPDENAVLVAPPPPPETAVSATPTGEAIGQTFLEFSEPVESAEELGLTDEDVTYLKLR